MLLSIILAAISYFASYPKPTGEAMEFMHIYRDTINAEMRSLSSEERIMALAIVAPEVSQFSSVLNFMELRSLFVLYVQQGKGDFSVGCFQMKPSFVEMLEREISKYDDLNTRYGIWFKDVQSKPDAKEKRRQRLFHLDDVKWQLRYLVMFYELAKKRTQSITFKTDNEKLRYFATLYNSGLMSDSAKVERMQGRKLFPRRTGRFNYSDVAEEFYNEFRKKSPL